ncbi:MAG: hypothetical protein J0M11_10830 [Anaerolineae bacterium]|nr:hypothetical protein [Anaerolineae bacterium]
MHTLPQPLIALIHYVELNNSGWWEETTDRCVLGILWYIKEPVPTNKIRKEVFDELGLDLKLVELNASLSRLISSDQVIDLKDGRYKLSLTCENLLSQQVVNSKALEENVKARFVAKISEVCPSVDGLHLWESFIAKLLVPLVSDSGARIYEFLFSNSPKNGHSITLTEEFLEELPEEYLEDLSRAISDFINPNDKEVAKFILSYLDAYFAVSSSGLSKKVTQKLYELRDNPAEFEVYVDTNFIYSVLRLHDNPSNEAAKDLLEMAETAAQSVKVKFVVSPITLEETQKSIEHKKRDLENRNYPSNLAEAATQSNISGLYRSFFEQASSSSGGANPYDYFSLYEKNLVRILEGQNIFVVNNEKIHKYFKYPDVTSDIYNRVDYEKGKYKDKAKSEAKITNDVVLWHYVKDLREKLNALPIDSKYWIVTVDYRFVNFDRFKSDKLRISPICMLPSQLIQVFRFFSPRSVDFEKIMLSTMRFPLVVKDYDPKVEKIALKIIKQLSLYEGIENMPVKTLQAIITDEGLKGKLSGKLSEAEEVELIREHLAQEIVEYEHKLQNAEKLIEENVQNSQKLVFELEETKGKFKQETYEFKSQIADLQKKVEAERQERLKEKKEAEGRKSLKGFALLSFMLILPYPLVLSVAFFFLKQYISNQWILYGGSIGFTLLTSAVLINLLINQGNRDDYIAENEVFKSIKSKLKWQAIVSFAISVIWLIASALLEEFAIRKMFS